jgi:DNA-3-methyladenine glycosylase II
LVREPEYWEDAKAALRAADPVLRAIIDEHEEPPLRSKGRVFETLVHSIVGQQISAKAEALRAVGLSGRKVEYIQGLAEDARWVDEIDWSPLTDDEVRKRLTALRGVGPWTAEMVLIFSLLRPDIFPLGDIGIVRSVERLYAEGRRLDPEELLAQAAPWEPYRTVAVWYLWRFLDAEPVEY